MPDVGNLVEMSNQTMPYLTQIKDYAVAASVLFYTFGVPAIFFRYWYLEKKKNIREWGIELLEKTYEIDRILGLHEPEIRDIKQPIRKAYALEQVTHGTNIQALSLLLPRDIRNLIAGYVRQVKRGQEPKKVLEEALRHPDIRNYFLSGLKGYN